MLIAAALIELRLPDAESIKAKRRVAQSIKARLRQRFNLSVAEVGDPDDWHILEIGCVSVGSDAVHLRGRLDRAVRFVENLGLAEVTGDDIVVAALDEMELCEEGE
jgi:uncharacterized protein YlxP (DUF503 family)